MLLEYWKEARTEGVETTREWFTELFELMMPEGRAQADTVAANGMVIGPRGGISV